MSEKSSSHWRSVFDAANKRKRIEELEGESARPDFWGVPEESALVMRELADLKEDIELLDRMKDDFKQLREITELNDSGLERELEVKITELRSKIKKEEVKVFLSGKYDKGNAILSVFAGAGGQDSQDWASMLLRMYERYLSGREYKTKIIHQSFGEGRGPEGRIGVKEATMEVKGRYAYGILKKEAGTHRLVRLSPFSSKGIRCAGRRLSGN